MRSLLSVHQPARSGVELAAPTAASWARDSAGRLKVLPKLATQIPATIKVITNDDQKARLRRSVSGLARIRSKKSTSDMALK